MPLFTVPLPVALFPANSNLLELWATPPLSDAFWPEEFTSMFGMFTFAVLDANTLSPSNVPVKVPAMTPAVRSVPAAPLNFKLALLAVAVAPPVPSSVKPDPFRTSETAASGFVLDELILPETSSQMIETGVAFVVFRIAECAQ